jgi:hypothetical protein
MKNLKDFLESKIVDDTLTVSEAAPNFHTGTEKDAQNHHQQVDPPTVLIMRRKSIRQFPNNQRVALYYVDKINKYVTVPYEAMQWSASMPEEFKSTFDQLKTIAENKTSNYVYINDEKIEITINEAESIISLHDKLNEENKKALIEMMQENIEQFGKVIDFALDSAKGE